MYSFFSSFTHSFARSFILLHFLYTSLLFIILLSMFAIYQANITSSLYQRRVRLCSTKVKVCSRDNIDYHLKFELSFILHSLVGFFLVLNIHLCVSSAKEQKVCHIICLFFLSTRRTDQFLNFFLLFLLLLHLLSRMYTRYFYIQR